MFTKLPPSVIRVAICSTVCEADSRPHRSCSDHRSSMPLAGTVADVYATARPV